MIVSDIKVTSCKGWCELQAFVKSNIFRRPFLLRYCFPQLMQEFISPENGDPFLAAVLLPAMSTGETVEIPAHVSPRLLRTTDQIQALYSSWHRNLSQVQVNARAYAKHPEPMRQPSRRGLFFSCGVDSYYSLLRNFKDHPEDEETITDLIVVRGFDTSFTGHDTAVFKTMLSNAGTVSRKLRKNVIPVATNIRDFGSRFVPWANYYIGAALASIALCLESIFDKVYIASTISLDRPISYYGSHPALDPLWSTDRLSISHDGAEVRRVDKTRFIVKCPTVTDTLRVCTYGPFSRSVYNCGVCEKCLRTMVALHIAGALHKCRTLPNRIDLRILRRITVQREYKRLIEELVTSLGSSGTDLAMKSALEEALTRSARPMPRRTLFVPLLPLAVHVPPLLRAWIRLWRATGSSPPSSVFDLFRFLR